MKIFHSTNLLLKNLEKHKPTSLKKKHITNLHDILCLITICLETKIQLF